MSKKSYLKIISVKLEFLAKYFRVFRLIVIIAYLTYLAMLIINVFNALQYIPNPGEVKIKFSPVKAKNDIINSIEGYFSAKQGNLEKNLSKIQERNPFSPYVKDDLENTDNTNSFSPSIIN